MDLLEKMATYVRVVEAGSIAAAARRSELTPGAVSRQIAALEAELGVTLLARTTRSMAVTADGRRYHEHCLRVLREVAEAQAVGRSRGVEGTVRVSAPVSFGLAALIPHVATLRDEHPALRVELHLEDRLLDCAFRPTRPPVPPVPGHPFRSTRALSERSDGIPSGSERSDGALAGVGVAALGAGTPG